LTTHVSEVETRNVHWQTGYEKKVLQTGNFLNGRMCPQSCLQVGWLVMISLKEKCQRIWSQFS